MRKFWQTVYCAFAESQIHGALPRINRWLVFASLLLSTLYVTLAYVLGREPNPFEVVFVFFCQTGCIYHVSELRTAVWARWALNTWPVADPIDIDVADTAIRRHVFHWCGKSLLLGGGLIALFVPPRLDEVLDLWQMVVTFAIVLGVFAIDCSTISDYSSRVWREVQLKYLADTRRGRREANRANPRSDPIGPVQSPDQP